MVVGKGWAHKDNLMGRSLVFGQDRRMYNIGFMELMPGFAASGPHVQGDDTISKLERLAKLKEQGLLTDAQFAAQKMKILEG